MKKLQYICPSCDQFVTSSIRTGEVDQCRTCGNRFSVKDGHVVKKAYAYVCPACNGQVASKIATGQINHRGVCGNTFSVQDGVVAQKSFCYILLRVSSLQRVCKKQCPNRPKRPSTCVQQRVLRQGRCSQQGSTLSCTCLPGMLDCCLGIAVVWAHCGQA